MYTFMACRGQKSFSFPFFFPTHIKKARDKVGKERATHRAGAEFQRVLKGFRERLPRVCPRVAEVPPLARPVRRPLLLILTMVCVWAFGGSSNFLKGKCVYTFLRTHMEP